MISEFYYGTAWHWPIPYLPRVMLSYNFTRTLKKPWELSVPLMMDSGAYSVILKHGKYPYSPEDYKNGIYAWAPMIAWTMDYPCEKSVRERGRYSVKDAQEMTINNQIELKELSMELEPSMVIQGYSVEEYLEHIDMIKEHGLLTERMGIGSICRRGQTKEIARIIRAIHANLPSWVKLHGFGIKKSVIKTTDAKFNLYSADSLSWDYDQRYGRWLEGQHNGQTYHDKIPRLISYIKEMESFLEPVEPLWRLLYE